VGGQPYLLIVNNCRNKLERRRLLGMGLTAISAKLVGCDTGEARGDKPRDRETVMIQLRRAKDRFHTQLDWLDSRHTFSFGGHYHPGHLGYRALRVINDDRVTPGAGFGTHGHRDMEIISYVLDGALEHKDSMGNGSVIRPGEVQRMSAGTGVRHSEYNPLKDSGTRFLQIWIVPERTGIEPSYEQIRFGDEEVRGKLRLVASPDGREGTVKVHQDVEVWAGRLEAGEEATFSMRAGRGVWVHVARGEVVMGETVLEEGDGAAIEDISTIRLAGKVDGEVLLFDLA